MKTKENSQKNTEELSNLKSQLTSYQDLFNLQNESFFRQQVLISLERIAIAEEKRNELMQEGEESEEEEEEE